MHLERRSEYDPEYGISKAQYFGSDGFRLRRKSQSMTQGLLPCKKIEEMKEKMEKCLVYCYSDVENHQKEDNQMSYLICTKGKEYGFMLSDTRIVDNNKAPISDNFHKIYAFPDEKAVIGWTGVRNYREGTIESLIAAAMKTPDFFHNLYLLLYRLQTELRPGQNLNVQLLLANNCQLFHHYFDVSYYEFKHTEVFRDRVIQSGSGMHKLSWERMSAIRDVDEQIDSVVSLFTEEIKKAIKEKNYPTVGGHVQGYLIDKKGTIVSLP